MRKLNRSTPLLANKLLKKFCGTQFQEEFRGDLEEEFQYILKRKGRINARIWYWLEVMTLIWNFKSRYKIDKTKSSTSMVYSNFKFTIRHLWRHKLFTAINIIGLAIGTASFILLGLFVTDELSYDNFHKNPDQLYRIQSTLLFNGITYDEATIAFPALEALESELPEVVGGFRIFKNSDSPLLEIDDKKFTEEKFFFADPGFFKLFNYEFISGDPSTALSDIGNLVVTEKTAKKYFGNQDPIGKILKYQNKQTFTISAVIKNPPANTHFKFDFIAPLEFQLSEWKKVSGVDGRENKWFWTGSWTYLRLVDENQYASVNAKLPEFVDQHFPERIKSGVTLKLQPVRDIHLHSKLDGEIEPNSHIIYVYIFSAIGMAILIIACINFTNLSTALSLTRGKEIGMRKALGAHKAQLVNQILGESLFTCFIALLAALIITYITLPVFNLITEKQLSLSKLLDVEYTVSLLVLLSVMGILAGIYPAILISKFRVVKILNGNADPGSKSAGVRKLLVVIQFTASVVLMVGIGIIHKQLNYINNKELGFQKDQILVIKARPPVNDKLDAFKKELLKYPQVKSVSGISSVPGKGTGAWRFVPEGGSHDNPVVLPLTFVDYEFLETTNVELMEGRFLSRSSPSDAEQAFILNQKAVELLEWKNDPIGRKLELFGPGVNTIMVSGSVIGVVKDFHFESLHHEVKPLVMAYYPDFEYYLAKVSTENFPKLVGFLDSKWKEFAPEWPFEFNFLDSEIDSLYKNEQKLSSTVNYFSMLAIFIGSFGLFALGSFTISRRVKEIGIRKVLGASILGIFMLVSKDFLKLILIAVLLAWPVSYFILDKWLQNFAYSIKFDFMVLVFAGIAALFVALIAISYHATKAALSNPVDSIKYE